MPRNTTGDQLVENNQDDVDPTRLDPTNLRSLILSTDIKSLKDRIAHLELLLAEKEEHHSKICSQQTERIDFLSNELQSCENNLFLKSTELDSIHESYARKLAEATEKHKDELGKLTADCTSRITAISSALEDARHRLLLADSTLELRLQLETEIETLKTELLKEKEASVLAASECERRVLQVTADFQHAQQELYEQLRERAKKAAKDELSFEQRCALQAHSQVMEDLHFTLEETNVIAKERNDLTGKLRASELALRVQQDAQKHWTIRCNRLVRANRSLKERLQLSEKARGEAEQKLLLEKENFASRTTSLAETVGRLQKELETLERKLHLKNKVAKYLRYVHDKVLAERSEVQQFFIDALADIKREVSVSRLQALNLVSPIRGPNSVVTSLSSVTVTSHSTVTPSSKFGLSSTFSPTKPKVGEAGLNSPLATARQASNTSQPSISSGQSSSSVHSLSTKVSPPGIVGRSPALKAAGSFFLLNPVREKSSSVQSSGDPKSPTQSPRKSPHLRTVKSLQKEKSSATLPTAINFFPNRKTDSESLNSPPILSIDTLDMHQLAGCSDFDSPTYVQIDDSVSYDESTNGLEIASNLIETKVKLEDLTIYEREKVFKFFLQRLCTSTSGLSSKKLDTHADRRLHKDIQNIASLFTPNTVTSSRDAGETDVGFRAGNFGVRDSGKRRELTSNRSNESSIHGTPILSPLSPRKGLDFSMRDAKSPPGRHPFHLASSPILEEDIRSDGDTPDSPAHSVRLYSDPAAISFSVPQRPCTPRL